MKNPETQMVPAVLSIDGNDGNADNLKSGDNGNNKMVTMKKSETQMLPA